MDNPKAHNLEQISYDLAVLKKMIACLESTEQAKLLFAQCEQLEQSIYTNQKLVVKNLLDLLEDLNLDIKYLEFDAHASRNEYKNLIGLIKKLIQGDEDGHQG